MKKLIGILCSLLIMLLTMTAAAKENRVTLGIERIDEPFVQEQLAGEYEKVAKENGFYYFDAAGVAKPSEVDRQHLDEDGHKIFAEKYSEFLLTEVL